jgi:hypothetical protein
MYGNLAQRFHVVKGTGARSRMDRDPFLVFCFGFRDAEVDTQKMKPSGEFAHPAFTGG